MVGTGHEKPSGVTVDGVTEEAIVGIEADEHEGGGCREPVDYSAFSISNDDSGKPAPLPLQFNNIHARVNDELGTGAHPRLEDRRRGETRTGKHPDTIGELGQVQPLLQG